MLAGLFELSQPGCLLIGAIDSIQDGSGVVPPLLVHFIAGYVNHWPQVGAEGGPGRMKR
jgi:hypothetical protein